MEVSDQTFNKICRICLIECVGMKSLFSKMDDDERNLFEILAFTADIHVKFDDTLPKQVCRECESALCKADTFKRRCLDSETILNNVYQNSLTKAKTSDNYQNCSIKDENCDIEPEINNYSSFETPNVIILGTRSSNDQKNVMLENCTMFGSGKSSYCRLTDSKLPITIEQPVKQEEDLEFEEDISLPDHYIEIDTETMEYKEENPVKTEAKTYLCVCGLIFTSETTYQTHLKKEHCDKPEKVVKKSNKNKIISIRKLGSVDGNQKTQSTHKLNKQIQQKDISSDKPVFYGCKFCLRQFKTQSYLKSHLLIHEKGNNKAELHQCSLCLRKFKKKTSLTAHIKRHEVTDSIKHTCKVCKREFKYKAYLENHILTMHSKKNGISCEICNQNFSNEESLELHRDSHRNEKKHQCSLCNKAFLMACTLKEHMRTHTGEKPFLCSQCGRGFSQKTNLAQHMRRHQGLKPFKCEHCEKRFVSKGELDAHSRKHSGAHPFVCDDCGNGFTTSSALVKHRRIHTGEKPYLCDLCPMRFAASGTLKNHRRTHTGERPFQCSYCEKAFVQRNDLISHIRCHTGEKPYVCTHCGQSFRKAAGLKSHVKMHVKEPVSALQGVSGMMHSLPEQ